MSELIITERSNMTAIADAVRNRTGITEELTIDEMINGINSIVSSGGVDVSDATIISGSQMLAGVTVTNMNAMFSNCHSLTSLDLSNFDMSNVTDADDMFKNCTNLKAIYVKDETAKTKIESSRNFPNTATVIIGSPS